MPVFSYTAKTAKGERIEGTIEANDRRLALQQIERLGQIPVAIREGASAVSAEVVPKKFFRLGFGSKTRMRQRELLIFTTELSDLLASGMKLSQALTTLANRKTGQAGDDIIRDLRDDIVRGASLSQALGKFPDTFAHLYISIIRIGEATGALGDVMKRLVDHYERMQEVREKVIMALVYPIIVMSLGVITLIFSMVFVIPKFKAIFDELHGTLPLPTRMLIGLSAFLMHYGWLLILAVIAAVVLFRRAIRQPAGRLWWHRFQLRVPLIRNIIATSAYASFARTLGTLLANGVPVLQALGIVEQTISNEVIAAEIHKARERVTDGTTISGPLAASKVFPPLMTDMLAIGEQTGDMSGALTHIARRYENELDRSVKIFTTALEPILIVLVAVLVGFVAVSILMAVFNLTNGLNA